jgi:hypothetical protein
MKRSKFTAIAAASALALSVAGLAFATDLLEGQEGMALSTFNQDCTDFEDLGLEIGAGEIGVHFVLTSPEADSGVLAADFSTDNVSGVASVKHGNSDVLHFYVVITGDLTTTVTSASTDVAGNNLVISHVCAGEAEVTEAPSFEASEAAETDAPSFEASEAAETDTPSFSGDEQDLTEPPTDAIGATGSSSPADGAWLLVVALGVLLASVVVLTPARAHGKR